MARESIEQQVVKHLNQLSSDKQQEVLEFIQSLIEKSKPKGKPGQTLLRFAGCIDHNDITLIKRAIEEGCENIDTNEW